MIEENEEKPKARMREIHNLVNNSLCQNDLTIFKNISFSHILKPIRMEIGELLLHAL